MLRKILAVLGGAIIGRILFTVMGAIGYSLFPLPPGLDMTAGVTDKAAVAAALASAPGGAFFLWTGWFLGTFTGVFFTQFIARAPRERWPVIAVEAFLLAGAIFTVLALPFPGWMWIGLAAFPLATWSGSWLAKRYANYQG